MSIDILKYLKGTRNSFYCNELNGIFYIIDDESSVNYYDCTTFKAYIVYRKNQRIILLVILEFVEMFYMLVNMSKGLRKK